MTSTSAGRLRRLPRSLAYWAFYSLPPKARRTLVRLGVGTYTVGAVVLADQVAQAGAGGGAARAGAGGGAGAAEAGAVGAGAGWLLMVRQPPGTGWSLPAGLLRRGERPAEGAAREMAEETGVTVDPAQLRPATPNAVVHTHGRWIDMVFTAQIPADTPLHADGAEILEVAWHRVDALPQVTPATARLLANYGMGPYTGYPEVLR